jgi:hypothetical protein
MNKALTLLTTSLILASSAFAAEPTDTQATIKVAGKTIALVKMAEQPINAEMVIHGDTKSNTIYDAQKNVSTTTGGFTVEVRQGARILLHLTVEDGTCMVEQVPSSR